MTKPLLIAHLKSLVLPFSAIILIPLIVLHFTRDILPGWNFAYDYLVFPLLLGGLCSTFGFYLLITTVSLFASLGRGTLAPWHPPKNLVIHGPYRYGRNPMITGVLFILLGQALIAGSFFLLGWCLLFGIANHIYIIRYEEPAMEERFGNNYFLYKENVPRWLARFSAWEKIKTDPFSAKTAESELNSF